MSRLDYIKDVQTREEIKNLLDRLGRLEARMSQGNVNINIGGGGDLTKHVWTHASRRSSIQNSGTDALDTYEMDWKNRHKYQPSVASYTPTKWEPHVNQTADLKKLDDPEGTEQNTVDPRGNSTWRGAAVKGAGNFGHGGPGTPPTSVSGLVFWFDARTVAGDNDSLAYDSVITKWVDRTGNYVGQARNGGGSWTNARLRQRYIRGSAHDAVDGNCLEGTGDSGTYPLTAGNPNAGAAAETGGVGQERWFDLDPHFDADNTTDLTIVALSRQLIHRGSVTGIVIAGRLFDSVTTELYAIIGPWPRDEATSTGVAPDATQPLFIIPGHYSGPSSIEACATAQVCQNGWISGNFSADENFRWDGLGHAQLNTFVLEAIQSGGQEGRRVKVARLNSTDQTLGTPLEQIGPDTSGTYTIREFAGGAVEWYQIACFNRELTTAEIQQVENYFAAIYNMNETEFVAGADSNQKQYAITLQKDTNNWIGFWTDSKGVTHYESFTDYVTDRARFQIRPEVIPSANFQGAPATDNFSEGELVWCDYGSGVVALLAVVDTDGAGTLGWREIWRT